MSSGNNSSVEQTKQATLCSKCNSFFANAACNDLCSKCHREEEVKRAKTQAAGAAVEALVRGPTQAATTSASTVAQKEGRSAVPCTSGAGVASTSSEADAAPEQKSARCQQCRKKVGLCGFKCKCGQLFCGQHRYAESHDCSFDYKTTERAKLTEANPVVQAMKVQKL